MSKRKNKTAAAIASALLLCLVPACSQFTSVRIDSKGKYVLTGWKYGPKGFLWICDYDPKTKTLTVLEER